MQGLWHTRKASPECAYAPYASHQCHNIESTAHPFIEPLLRSHKVPCELEVGHISTVVQAHSPAVCLLPSPMSPPFSSLPTRRAMQVPRSMLLCLCTHDVRAGCMHTFKSTPLLAPTAIADTCTCRSTAQDATQLKKRVYLSPYFHTAMPLVCT